MKELAKELFEIYINSPSCYRATIEVNDEWIYFWFHQNNRSHYIVFYDFLEKERVEELKELVKKYLNGKLELNEESPNNLGGHHE